MNDIFKLVGTIAINSGDANKAIDQTGQKANKLANTFAQAGQKVAKIGKTIAQGVAVVGAACTTAVGALLKASIDSFAEYEQLKGGVETLFGDSSDTILKYAKNAYKTAGISANNYMSTATSFAASLLHSLGGDTQAAATMTDIAIHDMADNANKLGTDIAMIQNAYQGFAKQNYTMLDNLKLGYGGTATEMARLINDSGVMGDTFVATAENLNQISFAKIIEAIHVVQTEMGIAGSSAEEVGSTIEGAFNAWKSSGSNLLTSLATGDEKSIAEATAAFAEQTQTLLDNLEPVITNVVTSIGTLLTELLPEIGQQALNFGSDIIANIVNGITGSGITSEDVKSAINSILDIGGTALDNTLSFIKDALAWITDNQELAVAAIAAIAGAFAVFKIKTDPIGTTIDLIVAGLALLIANWESVKTAIQEAWENILGFFGVDPEAFYQLMNDISEAWNTYVVTPINDAIAALEKFLGMNADKTVTVTYRQMVQTTAADIGKGVAEETGSSLLGDFATINSLVFASNPDFPWFTPVGLPLTGGEYGNVKPDGYEAHGLDYVPKDNFRAMLHLGEMVLPRNEAEHYRKGGSSPDMGGLEAAISNLIALTQQVVSNTAAGNSIYLDGGVLVGRTARLMDAELGNITGRKGRRV